MQILLHFELLTNDDILHGLPEQRLTAPHSHFSHDKPPLEGSLKIFEQMSEIPQVDALRV